MSLGEGLGLGLGAGVDVGVGEGEFLGSAPSQVTPPIGEGGGGHPEHTQREEGWG